MGYISDLKRRFRAADLGQKLPIRRPGGYGLALKPEKAGTPPSERPELPIASQQDALIAKTTF